MDCSPGVPKNAAGVWSTLGWDALTPLASRDSLRKKFGWDFADVFPVSSTTGKYPDRHSPVSPGGFPHARFAPKVQRIFASGCPKTPQAFGLPGVQITPRLCSVRAPESLASASPQRRACHLTPLDNRPERLRTPRRSTNRRVNVTRVVCLLTKTSQGQSTALRVANSHDARDDLQTGDPSADRTQKWTCPQDSC